MKTDIIVVGKTVDRLYQQGIENYLQRIGHYMPIQYRVIPELRNTKNLSEIQQKQKEGELILKGIGTGDYLVLLDEHGKEYRSVDFAKWLEGKQWQTRQLTFVIGGPYGFSDDVYARANECISLSKMTFNHQMVRLILAEQLYRACTILKGEPYHHE